MKKESKENFYFSHDYTARTDIKIKKLIVTDGYEGYGIFWALIEDLYQNENLLPLDYDCIAFDLRSNSKIIKSIINDFDLFKLEDDTFSSLSVQRRLDMRNKRSKKARRSAMKRWDGDANASKNNANASEIDANALKNDANASKNDANAHKIDATAMRLQCDRNAIKESKVKESKVKESIVKDNNINTKSVFNFKKELLEYGFDELLVDEWMAIRKKKRAVNSEFAFNSFIAQVERTGAEKNEVMRIIAEKQWAGFNHAWIKNLNNNITNNLNYYINETDRQAIESAKRKQELYEYARSVGMVGN